MADPPSIPDYEMKLVAVGDGAVGKTCLLKVFVNEKFPDQYELTMCDSYSLNVTEKLEIKEIAGKNAIAQLWDTPGQEEFDWIRMLIYENTSCFILCFCCADMITFNNIESKWLYEIRKSQPEAKILLVGTKSDLRKKAQAGGRISVTREKSIRQQEVPETKIKEFVKKLRIDGYVECSAMNDPGSVKKVFLKACRLGLEQLGVKLEDETDHGQKCGTNEDQAGCGTAFKRICTIT